MREEPQRFEPVRGRARVGRQAFVREDVPRAQERGRFDELGDRGPERFGFGVGRDDGEHRTLERVGEPRAEVRTHGVRNRHPLAAAVHDVAEDGIVLETRKQLPER